MVSHEWLSELPDIPASQVWQSDDRQRFFSRERDRGIDELEQRSLYWTLRISDQSAQWERVVQNLPGYQWAQVGFLAASDNSALYAQAGRRFGVLVCCDDPGEQQRVLNQQVRVDGESFPIGVVTAWFEPHLRIVSPNYGCVVGWARSRRASGQPRQGWLTAGHVSPGNKPIRFSDGGRGKVTDRAATCVDAAVVGTDRPPSGLAPARVASCLIVGRTVELHDQRGRALPMAIHTVDPALGATASRHLPLRFSLDRHGQPGDSGAAIDDSARGEIVGLYLGRYVDYQGAGTALGVGLAAHYLTAVMDMEISR